MDSERRAIELRRARSVTMWKVIASASAAAALAIAVITSLRDDHVTSRRDASDETQEPGGVETAGAPRAAAPVGPQTATVVDPSDTSAGVENAASAGATSTTTTTSATIDTGGDTGAAAGRDLAAPAVVAPAVVAPAVVATATAVEASSDAGTGTGASDAGTTSGYEDTTASVPDAGDAGPARDPWAPPSMSAGAGPFSTQAPYWGASAWVSNPNAGAGRFTTEAPPWAASAFTSDPNAGAGPFTTEWNIPAYGVWPYWPWGTTAPR